MNDSLYGELRAVNWKHFYEIWKKAQKGDLETLTEEDKHLAKIMLDHAGEYFNQFEFADVMADHECDPATEVNPFLHVTLHAVAEKQVEARDPVEAFQFYNAMLKNKCSRHEAIHLLLNIMINFFFRHLEKKPIFPSTITARLWPSTNPENRKRSFDF